MLFLRSEEWKKSIELHCKTVQQWTVPFRERRRAGKSHPVHDFLFVYYNYSPAKLEQWHPGIGVTLKNAREQFETQECESERYSKKRLWSFDHYSLRCEDIFCDPEKLSRQCLDRLNRVVALLESTDANPASFSCYGLHEWAMVYKGREIRHESTTPFRLPQSQIDHVVEERTIRCTHFDAFRFFANEAVQLNTVTPTGDSRKEMEQPGCIHANMDLYKWAYKSMPWVGSELLMKCFELAIFAREIDMRASPYDLSSFGDFPPIKIESPEGRREYRQLQTRIAERAHILRSDLITAIRRILDASRNKPT